MENNPINLAEKLQDILVGQPEAIDTIVPYIQMHRAGLAPEGRPIGVVMLLGPTGTGKTRTVEALAEVLHGSSRNVLRVDCGEYQLDHEVAKLIGSPPGYLGHKETPPVLNQRAINAACSPNCNISLLLFDEIEKAAPSMNRIMLGILDRAILSLGDNSKVDFQNTIIFLTSNLGAKELRRIHKPDFGLEGIVGGVSGSASKAGSVGMSAVKRKFSPEFVNRIDSVITYNPLDRTACDLILSHIIGNFNRLVESRLGLRAFTLKCTIPARNMLLDLGVSLEFGARELKRTVQRKFIQPVAVMVEQGRVPPLSSVVLGVKNGEFDIYVKG